MKSRFSFSRFLANDKLMMIVSILLAIGIWFGVISGPANVQERSIAMTVTVDLTNTYAYQSGLRVLGEDTFSVKVNVSGPWSVLTKLDADDIRVRPDLTSITGAGDVQVPLTASRNSDETDYDILSVSPKTVSVMCDYWQEGTAFKVTTDVTSLTVTDPKKNQIGEPFLDTTAFPEGKITIDGPQSVVSRIHTLVARVNVSEVLSELKQYTVPLVALDADGEELDLTYCVFREIPDGNVTVTVPVWEQRHVEIGYNVLNAPSGMELESLLTVEPTSLELLGPTADLNVVEEQLANIGTIDFAKLALTKDSITFPLSIVPSVRAIDSPTEIKVSLNKDSLSQKTMTLVANTNTVSIKGSLGDLKVTIPQQTLDQIVLVGDETAINAISSAALTLEIDLGSSPKAGTKQYIANLKINGYDDVWAYYGDQNEGIPVYITLA